MSKKVAVVLSGCGVFDGAEINEAVLTLLAVEQEGAEYQAFAPDKDQFHVIEHNNGQELLEGRNVLVEAARIVRGNVLALDKLDVEEFDALLIPGGFGVAKNLSDFAISGDKLQMDSTFERVLLAFKQAEKPVGYMCIAPVLMPKIYAGVKCTIGSDEATAQVINALGGEHINCPVDDIVVDDKYKVVSTPAYMLASNISEAKSGIDKLVHATLSMA
ncbi:isoprenoid biosynthesis glyoxalase ElbB [Vibrio hannami]|uniref:isoprenoid biosynthesis glyoxalase ElbB n=1 Tax=Vibrio hannami TaxID=2717094 RepID=UPI00240E9F98|nr:isoprenoid biosynthesis glyoxalase ElbB [Vibrio hannami]MDG3085651.1 isoprenoid biosynthesis glyoxalase ElbB [Vibrio hannami]